MISSLKDIRRRIQAAQSTQKITRVMQLVATAKVRTAQNEAEAGRSYTKTLHDSVARISRRLGPRAPVMWRRATKIESMGVLVITSDRGFCGAFNESLLHAVEEGIEEHQAHNIGVKLFVIGRKGVQYLSGRGYDVEEVPFDGNASRTASWAVSRVIDRFCCDESAGSYVAFNRFVNMAHYEYTVWNLLPMYAHGDERERYLEYEYEPSRSLVLDYLCVEYLLGTVRQAILESRAAEYAARMIAMDGASKNADEMIAHLTSVYNRARQESITSELMDIVGAAEALR